MREIRARFATACALLCLIGFVACGPSQEEQVAASTEADMASLNEAKAALDAKRQEIQDLKEKLEAALAQEGEEAGEGEDPVTGLEASLTALESSVADQADAYNAQLAEFINANAPIVGEPYTEVQLQAIRMKSDEDMALAQEYIDRGGDYRRALNIYRDALNVDPDNQKLKDAMARAEENRFVSEERFAQVRKGMTEDEVRAALGPVNLRNIRKYEDRGVVAWFYSTGEGGAAAAVWFREDKKRGELLTYQLKYDAVAAGGSHGEADDS